jgi:uncharacterized protein
MPIDYRGTTALITGASSGLGDEFARQFAARGANLILVARRADRLETLAVELRAKHGITVTAIPADLAALGAAETLRDRVAELGLEVYTLVNSAGFGTKNRFENEDAARVREEVDVNVGAVVDVTHAFYPELLRHGNGALVNVSSTASFQPVPLMAVYAATKAFVLSFTEALWYEAKGSGLRVLALCPGATRTEFFDIAGEDARIGGLETAAQVVTTALRALDRRNPPPSVISGRANAAQAFAERFAPRRTVVSMAGKLSERDPS